MAHRVVDGSGPRLVSWDHGKIITANRPSTVRSGLGLAPKGFAPMQEHCTQLPLFPVEEWRPVPIPEYAAYYSVSSLGRVRTEQSSPRSGVGHIMRPWKNWHGYVMVTLSHDGTKKSPTMHSLVAAAFIGPRPKGWDIDHIDNDKSNNAYTNLEYVTRRVNLKRADAMGLTRRGELNGRARFTEDDVRAIRSSKLSQSELGRHYGCRQSTIWGIQNYTSWKHVT